MGAKTDADKEFLYKIVDAETNSYPISFGVRFKPTVLVLQITKRCTNTCRHCSNYSSPAAREYLTIKTVKNIIDQAVRAQYEAIIIWGGEPVLHPDFSAILEYCLDQNLQVLVNTNAFWSVSREVSRKFIAHFEQIVKNKGTLTLEISCDLYHQEQKRTPLINIVNILEVLTDCTQNINYNIRSVKIPEDNTVELVLELLRERRPHINLDKIRKNLKYNVLLCSIGRFKNSSLENFKPYYDEGVVPELGSQHLLGALSITASGQAVPYYNWVGDEIFSLGSVYNTSLAEIEQNLNKHNLLQLACMQPIKYFFYPFRKYLNIQQLIAKIISMETNKPWFVQDQIARLMQLKDRDFDKSLELNQARAVYLDTFITDKALHCLDVIDYYGDLTDVFALRYLRDKTIDVKVRGKIEDLLNTTYS